MKVEIVYNSDIKKIKEADYPSVSFSFIDERTLKGKKQGFKTKGHFAARLSPFIGIYDDEGKAIKGFYSETGEDVVESLIQYLNENR